MYPMEEQGDLNTRLEITLFLFQLLQSNMIWYWKHDFVFLSQRLPPDDIHLVSVILAHTAGVDYLGRRLGNLWHLFREKKVASMVLKENKRIIDRLSQRGSFPVYEMGHGLLQRMLWAPLFEGMPGETALRVDRAEFPSGVNSTPKTVHSAAVGLP